MVDRCAWLVSLLLLLPLACGGSLTGANDGAAREDAAQTADGAPARDSADVPPRDGADVSLPRDQGQTPAPDRGDPGNYDGQPGEQLLSYGGRQAVLYVPSGYDHATPIPLLVGFHGSGDSGSNFYAIAKSAGWTSAAEPARFALLVPNTKSPYSDFALWSGNPVNDVDEMKAEMADVLALVDEVARHFNIARDALHAFGFSNGGLFVAVAGMANAQVFASLTVMAYGWGAQYPLVTPTRKISTQLACGDADSFYAQAQQSASFLTSQGHESRLLTAAGVGHRFSSICQSVGVGELVGWMAQQAP